MRPHRYRRRTRAATAAVLLLAVAACTRRGVVRPLESTSPEEAASAAVGGVSVSAPMFTPIDEFVDFEDDRRLKFGKLRDEATLAAEIRKPTLTSERKQFTDLLVRALVRAAGTSLTTSDALERTKTTTPSTDPTKPDATTLDETRTSKRTREFESPDVGPLPDAPEDSLATDTGGPLAELRKLLGGSVADESQDQLQLAPDQLATLIAAAKTYMVNLEDFHNIDGYAFDRGIDQDYVPYKMHFTVTVQPGWFTRWYGHDAVAELEVAPEGELPRSEAGRPAVIVLGVTPAETAQTVSAFTAALDQLRAALAFEGQFRSVAVNAQVERIRALAERLRGLRADKTMSVGFSGSRTIRVRFHPASVADLDNRRDLDAVSRLLTATVLVRRRVKDDGGAVVHLAAAAAFVEPGASDAHPAKTSDAEATGRLRDGQRDEAVADERATGVAFARAAARRACLRLAKTVDDATDAADLGAQVRGVLHTLDLPDGEMSARMEEWIAGAPKDAGSKASGPLWTAISKLMATEPARSQLERAIGGCRSACTDLAGAVQSQAKAIVAIESVQIPPRGVACTCRLTSYFVPSVWDEGGDRAPIRGAFFSDPRPVELLRDRCRLSIRSWIPPWLGEIRRPLEIKEASGYYRLSVADTREHLSGASAVRRNVDEILKAREAGEARLSTTDAALAAAEKDLLEARADLQRIGLALAGSENDVARRKALTPVLSQAQDNVAFAQGRVDRLSAERLERAASLADLHAEWREQRGRWLDQLTQAEKSRASASDAGRVVVRIAVRGPKHVLTAGGKRLPLTAEARVVGLTDCATRSRACPLDVLSATPLRHVEKSGYYEGVIELDGVDLSSAVPTFTAGDDRAADYRPIDAVVHVVLRRPDLTVRGAGGSGSPSVDVPGGIEQSTAIDVRILPWHAPPTTRDGK